MVEILKDKDITKFTTFNIPVRAKYFAEYSSERELLALSRKTEFLENEVLHIGGGSNLLFLSDYNGLVLHSKIKGIKEYRKDENTVYAIVGAGEKWTDFVEWCLSRNLAGVENLVNIPGEVGASAVQNVGAYGVEAKDVIFAVECFDIVSRKVVRFSNEECRFGYRDSIFKHEGKGRYFILRVSFLLNPDGVPRNLKYGPLKELSAALGRIPSIRDVADEVAKIRKSKLPDPMEIGNAGSFFKNPVISESLYKSLKRDYPDMPGYPTDDGRIKLSAAWLIDKAGMKEESIGGAEVYKSQPLVIVNRSEATAKDVKRLADEIIMRVRSRFYVTLKPEVNYIDGDIKVTVLGSGTSKGVPEVGCECEVCRSTDSRDKRLRASILVETMGLRLLVDVSPDFRYQAIRSRIVDLDAVLVTHSHYDHVGGFDDLRPFCGQGGLPVYVRKDVNDDLHRRLDYSFREKLYPGVPTYEMKVVKNEPFFINGLRIIPIEGYHGELPIYGYRIGDFAYVTDVKTIPEEEKWKLEGLKVLIVNALRDKPHFAHHTIDEAVRLIEELKPQAAYLTHFNHEAGFHEEIDKRLPENVHPAHDGLVLRIS